MKSLNTLGRKLNGERWTLRDLHWSSWGFLAEWVSPSGLDWVEGLGQDYFKAKLQILNSLDN